MTQFIVFTCDFTADNGAKCGDRFWSWPGAGVSNTIAAAEVDGWAFRDVGGQQRAYCPKHSGRTPTPNLGLIATLTLPSNVTPIRKR